jgi:hypothetical protein
MEVSCECFSTFRPMKPGARPADLRAVSGDNAGGLQRLHAAQAGRRRQRDGVREIDVGYPAVTLERGQDGTIYPVRNMLRHEIQPTA